MILRVLHYNPFSANQLRLEEILRATRNFSIACLVATQRRALVGLEVGYSKQFGCTIVEAGWAGAPLSNKSAGDTHRTAQTFHFGAHTSDMDTTTIIARSSTGGTSQRRFFRSVCLLHVSSSQTTNCIKKRRVSEDRGTSVGMAGRPFE